VRNNSFIATHLCGQLYRNRNRDRNRNRKISLDIEHAYIILDLLRQRIQVLQVGTTSRDINDFAELIPLRLFIDILFYIQ
jgi:hypothetical protein